MTTAPLALSTPGYGRRALGFRGAEQGGKGVWGRGSKQVVTLDRDGRELLKTLRAEGRSLSLTGHLHPLDHHGRLGPHTSKLAVGRTFEPPQRDTCGWGRLPARSLTLGPSLGTNAGTHLLCNLRADRLRGKPPSSLQTEEKAPCRTHSRSRAAPSRRGRPPVQVPLLGCQETRAGRTRERTCHQQVADLPRGEAGTQLRSGLSGGADARGHRVTGHTNLVCF